MSRNIWLERRVISYAHQGGAREAPSSTLFAVRQALENGATAIELDVHATSDGHLVVCHDPTLERTTNGSGAIAEHTLAEVQALDNAYWFVPGEDVVEGRPEADYPLRGRAPDDPELRVASLAEVMEAFPGVVLNLDIKLTAPDVEPYEGLLAQLLATYERSDDVIVASFLDRATDAFAKASSAVAISMGTLATAEFYRCVQAGEPPAEGTSRYVALQVPASYGEMTVVDERFVEGAHDAGLAVHVWTINDSAEMARLIQLGVDGIITDEPSVLNQVLIGSGTAWVP